MALQQVMAVGKAGLASACMAACLVIPAHSQFSGSNQPGVITTVGESRSARNGARVSLTGTIKKELRRAQYLFHDQSGEIRVRIEHELWRGREVTNQTLLRLRGRVDADVRGRFVDAYYFQVVD